MQALSISGVQIRQDEEGRYCLNHLHRAAGGEGRHQPSNWLRLEQTRALIAEMDQSSEVRSAQAVNGGSAPGTYVAKELVYAYAMWISPAFHLAVIRAYDAMVTAKPLVLDDPAALREALLGYTEKVMALQGQVQQLEPKAQALDRIASLDGSTCITDAAKSLGVKPSQLFGYMDSHGWTYVRPGAGRIGYQTRINSGDLVHKVHDVNGSVRTSVRVTAGGLAKLAKVFSRQSELPL